MEHTPDVLKGVGHFTVWFVAGWIAFFLLLVFTKARSVALYGPFLPYLLGALGAAPYALVSAGLIGEAEAVSTVFNLFLFYGWLNDAPTVVRLFGNFHVNVAVLAGMYGTLLVHYIRLVRRVRGAHAE